MKRKITGCTWLVVIIFLVCITLDSHAQNFNQPMNTVVVTGLNLAGLTAQASGRMFVNLKTYKGFYLVAESGGGGSLHANRNQAREWETFTLIDKNGGQLMSGDQVNLMTYDKKHYLVAEGGGGREIKANRTIAQKWETFVIRKIGNSGVINYWDKVSLQAINGQYMVAEGGGGGSVNANRKQAHEWETFILADASVRIIPGIVLGLRHNQNQEHELNGSGKYTVLFSAPENAPFYLSRGGDEGAPLHRGYEWWRAQDIPTANPSDFPLPPGIIFGLKHSTHQKNERITVFGRDPVSGPSSFANFKKQFGGDLGAPGGHGYFWYESTGKGFSDWRKIADLPKWTVVGLKHSKNQPHKKFIWQGKTYDPANPNITPPQGFVRRFGGDHNLGSGQGFYWYEKVTGKEVVAKPDLTIRLERSLILSSGESGMDDDMDGLQDYMEVRLANAFRPYVVFDNQEHALRKPYEPVTLFQVRPIEFSNNLIRIRINWIFLFAMDGGYGPGSDCHDDHPGDNDDAWYELESIDGGSTWKLVKVSLSFKGLEWPKNSRMEVYDLMHPFIYMSASKHHEYFTRDWDENDSLYSKWGCNDDVNGGGIRILVNLWSLQSGVGNNMGEPEAHWIIDFHPNEMKRIDDIASNTVTYEKMYKGPLMSGNPINLLTYDYKHCLFAKNGGGGEVKANGTGGGLGKWETLILIDINGGLLMSGDRVRFMTQNRKYYLVAEGGGGKEIKADRTQAGPWETFIIRKASGSGIIEYNTSVTLQTDNGQLMAVESGGKVKPNRNRTAKFINSLNRYFPGQSVWGTNFYTVGRNGDKMMGPLEFP